MNDCPDRRGQAVQVGAIVILGFVVLAISIFQAQAVPQETVETEVEHNQKVADQLEVFGVTLAETTASGTPQTTTLRLGATYDDRPLFIYPPPTAGSLETADPSTVTIENAVNESGQFENYWDGNETRYKTSSIQYNIDYRELRDTPRFTFEYGFAVAEFENQSSVRSPFDQPIIDGDHISLIVYDGDLAEQSTTTESIAVERVTDNTTVTITEKDDPIRLNLSSELGEDARNKTLSSVDESNVNDRSYEDGNLSIELDPGEYELTVHKVDVGQNATEPEPTYLRDLGDDEIDVRTSYNDQVDETVGAWVFNESEVDSEDELEGDDIEETIQIPPDGETYDPPNVDEPCLTIERDLGNASSYETLHLDDGGSCL